MFHIINTQKINYIYIKVKSFLLSLFHMCAGNRRPRARIVVPYFIDIFSWWLWWWKYPYDNIFNSHDHLKRVSRSCLICSYPFSPICDIMATNTWNQMIFVISYWFEKFHKYFVVFKSINSIYANINTGLSQMFAFIT